MSRAQRLLCLGIVLAAVVSTVAAEDELKGTYKLSYYKNLGTREVNLLLLKLETKDGKLTGKQIAGNPRMANTRLGEVRLEGKTLRLTVKDPGGELTFAGKTGAGEMLGTLSKDTFIQPARLVKTDLDTIDAKNSELIVHAPPLDKAQELANKAALLRVQARREGDEKKKAELQKQADEVDKEIPNLDREMLAKHADSPAIFMVGYRVLLGSKTTKTKPTVAEARRCAETLVKAARAYGPKLETETLIQLTERLETNGDLQDVALEYAKKAEQALSDQVPAETQVHTLKLLATALRNSHQTTELNAVDARIAKLDALLDREYLAKIPPFKPAHYPGRKAKSDRVAVLELFTGAQCPPCVAADVAFDALEKTYQPKELILLQYHMHIPYPDPLTNPDAEARWKYYSTKFPKEIAGTPSTLFNGNPKSSGGGPLSRAEIKYREYRELIDPLLENTDAVRLTATAKRQGDRLTLKAEVADLPEPGENKRLRFVLVEEAVRYLGSNKVRIHHHVVRALPGGAEGLALKDKQVQHTVTVNLDQLHQQLATYLDDYAKKQTFRPDERPLDLKNLKVVALVQDDATREILQATQVDVAGGPAAH